MDKQQLLNKWGEAQKVGTDGHVRLVDVMGDDAAIVQAARTSYGKGTKTVQEDRGLIRYLMRHHHTTPFEMCEIKLHVRVPMDIWRQWIRHRTASVNEYSTRYSEAIDSQNTTLPGEWRLQSTNNKQGSSGLLEEWPDPTTPKFLDLAQKLFPDEGVRNAHIYHITHEFNSDNQTPGEWLWRLERNNHEKTTDAYKLALLLGTAREQARKNLPLSTYTEAYWKVDLHNLFHFLRLRLDSHAQQEIREFGEAIANIVRDWVPEAWAAFEDYRLGAVTFSASEMKLLRELYNSELIVLTEDPEARKEFFEASELTSKRERIEFWNKIK